MTRCILFILFAASLRFSVIYSQPSFFPPSGDTVPVTFDKLHLSTKAGLGSSFSCSWEKPAVHRDSIIWLIDGMAPSPTTALVINGPNPRDLPPEYSTGSTLYMQQQADTGMDTGVHLVTVRVKVIDTAIIGHWYFRYRDTRYKQILAVVSIDSSWTLSDLDGWSHTTHYRILSASGFDTTLFGNAVSGFGQNDFSDLEYDTAGMMREFLFTRSQNIPPKPKDTFECAIIQVIRGDSRLNDWLISDTLGAFLDLASPPFPPGDALRHFNRYVNDNRLYRGYAPPAGDIRFGPLFLLTPGDAGWRLTARHDNTLWYLTFTTGKGDCPAGCTIVETTVYTVAPDGTVEPRTAPVRWRSQSLSTQNKHGTGTVSVYSLLGRSVNYQTEAIAQKPGAYIVRDRNNTISRRVILKSERN